MTRYYGHKPSPPDPRDYVADPSGLAVLDEVDLRRGPMPLVFDQGQLGSCTANAVRAARSRNTSRGSLMPSVVAGVDLGGRRARICLLSPERPSEPVWWGFEPSDRPGHVEAARRAAEWARLHWNAPGAPACSVCWIETPMGPHHRSVFQLSVMAGALLAVMPVATSVEFVSAGECRKLVGLSARASKEEILGWVGREIRLADRVDEHEADAYVVARAVLAFGAKKGVA